MMSLEIPSDLSSTDRTSTNSRWVGPTKCGDGQAIGVPRFVRGDRVDLGRILFMSRLRGNLGQRGYVARVRVVLTVSSFHLRRL
jgi:hypothetical protein